MVEKLWWRFLGVLIFRGVDYCFLVFHNFFFIPTSPAPILSIVVKGVCDSKTEREQRTINFSFIEWQGFFTPFVLRHLNCSLNYF